MLAYGNMVYGGQQYNTGYFVVKDEAKITGPAKLYIINVNPLDNDSESDDVMKNAVRSSVVRQSRVSSIKEGKMDDSVLRRTLYTRN